MPDYLVFLKDSDGPRYLGLYQGKLDGDAAVKDAYVGPGRYLAVDVAAIEEFNATAKPEVTPAS